MCVQMRAKGASPVQRTISSNKPGGSSWDQVTASEAGVQTHAPSTLKQKSWGGCVVLHQTGKFDPDTIKLLFDSEPAVPSWSFLQVPCTCAHLHREGDFRLYQVSQKQEVPVPLGRCGPAVPPGSKMQRGEGGPRLSAARMGSECYGVAWLGCTWSTSREERDKEPSWDSIRRPALAPNAQGNLLQNSNLWDW